MVAYLLAALLLIGMLAGCDPGPAAQRQATATTTAATAAPATAAATTTTTLSLLDTFGAKFPAGARLIRSYGPVLRYVAEAERAGARFGGYAEEGGDPTAGRAYSNGDTVYVPKSATDPVLAMRDFLFELHNAIRAPTFAALVAEARKGSGGRLTARQYAYKVVEQEVEAGLRIGELWSSAIRPRLPSSAKPAASYDLEFFYAEYQAFRDRQATKDDIIRDILRRRYEVGGLKGKTVEQVYMDQYKELSGGG